MSLGRENRSDVGVGYFSANECEKSEFKFHYNWYSPSLEMTIKMS